ncbi:RNA polymerase sigma factor [Frigoriglobus tundricola]|uniref:ECF RNA polymerase sigma factor SigE n=1 Tax=Frigoriglobus tundricola TaxID=2774151 RepID=A0A6M5YWA7_9BACT|nr:RNA polymerase sigma factor [Frigoriglobus tundricola]QJW98229.1 hypothetical protein FTUN_5813 [Frigoriglobus tundricola]
MTTESLSATVARLGHAVRARAPAPGATDGQLLGRFVGARDEPAFAELVRRLGPMVLGVCRRVTADAHLAEDAFQAAFLVLARRAGDVRPRESVRGWLYGVAARTAKKARVMSARRRAREVSDVALPDAPAPVREEPDGDAVRALDEELAALPDHLRAAVVLCELDGLSRKAAAQRLGLPEGTLSSRLAKARDVLADRMRKRGIVLGAAGVSWVFGQLASAAVPPRLVSATAALADGTVPVPASVAGLSHGVLRTMFLTKLGAAFGALLIAVACAALLPGVAAQEPPKPPVVSAPQEKPADDKKPRPAPRPAGPGTLLLARASGLVTLTPDGKEADEWTAPKGTSTSLDGRLSPDGKRIVFLVTEDGPPRVEPPEAWPYKVVVHTAGEKEPVIVDTPAKWASACWTADGSRVVVTKKVGDTLGDVENVVLDPATGKTEALALPEGARVLDCGRDGKTFLVARWVGKKGAIGLAEKGDKEVRVLAELKGWTGRHAGRLSPDGKRVLYTDADPEQKDANKWGSSARPYLLDVPSKKREELGEFPDNAQCLGVAWAPDGKRVAYTWKQLHAELLKKDTLNVNDAQIETEAFLVVADADGKNAKTVASAKLENAINMIFGTIDWR